MTTTLQFLGAADTVTGSRYLIETGRSRVLVDCGLFQGPKKLRERNWDGLGVEPASIDAVVLTHAHIDHAGYLPRLVRAGFAGPVYCTAGTRDLLQILLPDAAHLQEEEARHANLAGYSRHTPALPLYDRADAEAALARLAPVPYHREHAISRDVGIRYARVGHIIGAATVQVRAGATSIAFSGDVGRPVDPIMRPPEPIEPADYLVVESTYGDRRHPPDDVADVLARTIHETVARRGVVLVPSFAVGRAQHLLHLLAQLRAAGRIPELPIYLDSPMAIDATRLFLEHRADHRLDDAACAAMSRIATMCRLAEDSKAIDRGAGPMIVVAASGMATGGRILHHLCRFLPEPTTTVLFVGFQAAGTRGRTLLDGADELKLLGRYVPVRARIAALEGLSAHADHAELVAWLRHSGIAPRRAFVTHGEPAAADAFRRRLVEAFGWDATVPDLGQRVRLEPR